MIDENILFTDYPEKKNTVILSGVCLNHSTFKELIYRIQNNLNKGYKNLIVDISKQKKFSTDKLGGLGYLVQEAYVAGCRCVIVSNNKKLRKIFKIAHIEKEVDIVESCEQAIQVLSGRRQHV